MGRKRTLALVGATVLMLALVACSDQNAPLNAAHRDGWVAAHRDDPGAAGNADPCRACHGVNLEGSGAAVSCLRCHPDGPGSVPHPLGSEWLDSSSASFHGVEAGLDPSFCAACHGTDFRGGISGVSCYTCHFGPDGSQVPDGSSWSHGTIPHDSFGDEVAVCNACHDLKRIYQSGPSPCHDCHLSSTHALGQPWLDPTQAGFHGAVAPTQLDDCARCHGSDFQGGLSGVSCFSCHFGPGGSPVPSGTNWTHGSVPHDAFAAQIAVCNACHDTTRLYGVGPGACHDCHLSATHALGQPWLDPTQAGYHGEVAPTQLDECARCHGSDLQGGSSGVSCSTCHFGPSGSQVPSGTGWNHGSVPHDAFAASGAVCSACHDQLRAYGQGPSPCHNCHTGATHALGQPWLDPTQAGFHGAVAPTQLDDCARCHGSDFQGGISGVSCSTCHFGPSGSQVPGGTSWTHGSVPHDAFGAQIAVCNACHETTRLYGVGPGACHDCHVSATHASGQPWLDPSQAGFHGDVAATQIDECARCHGSDFQGGISGVSCSSCHFGPSGSKVPSGTNWTHGSVPHDAFGAQIAVCNACHETTRLYAGVGPGACHDCHVSATHASGQDWLDPTRAGYHGEAAATQIDECALCHGSDFQGGSSGVSCSTCHFGPSGSKVPSGTNWTHGGVPHDAFGAQIAVCNACHETTRQYGVGPGACHDCHALHDAGPTWLLPDQHAQQAIDNENGVSGALDCFAAACHTMTIAGGGVSPACRECHLASNPAYNRNTCSSCHATPPNNNSTALGDRPTRVGEHDKGDHRVGCDNCHFGRGAGTLGHFDRPGDAGVTPNYPAEVIFPPGINGTWSAPADPTNGGSCSTPAGICHDDQSEGPWY